MTFSPEYLYRPAFTLSTNERADRIFQANHKWNLAYDFVPGANTATWGALTNPPLEAIPANRSTQVRFATPLETHIAPLTPLLPGENATAISKLAPIGLTLGLGTLGATAAGYGLYHLLSGHHEQPETDISSAPVPPEQPDPYLYW